MPAKNTVKQFVPNAYYHLYNRGVEKRIIFCDDKDYGVFLSYLKTYLLHKNTYELQNILSDPNSTSNQKSQALKLLRMNNFTDSVTLHAYCLMPNHFHLLIKQKEADTIDRFMNSLFTRYSMYFNKRYNRVGKLFQGIYKAVLVYTDEQLLHLSRYIHCNPTSEGTALRSYEYSSYPEYLGLRKTNWIKTETILSYFSQTGFNSYKSFVEDNLQEESIKKISSMIIDYD